MSRRVNRYLTVLFMLVAGVPLILAATAWACNPEPPPCDRSGIHDGNYWSDPTTDTLRVCFQGQWIYVAEGTEEPDCRPGEEGNTWRDGRYGGADRECQDLGPSFGHRWVDLLDIYPEMQTSYDCYAEWDLTVPQDPSRSTSVRMDFGDGLSETRTVLRGSGTTSMTFTHYYEPYTTYGEIHQRATIVETGVYDDVITDHVSTDHVSPLP